MSQRQKRQTTIVRDKDKRTRIYQAGTVSVTVAATATDPSDEYQRIWGIWIDTVPGDYIGVGQYTNPPTYQETLASGSTLSYDTSLSSGSHTLYFGVTQSGGTALGTYSGTITVNGKAVSFSGVDDSHQFEVQFTLGSGGGVSTGEFLGIPTWGWIVIAAAIVGGGGIYAVSRKKK